MFINYKNIVKTNLKTLDSIKPLLYFERNKKVFNELSLSYDDFSNYFDNELNDIDLINQQDLKPDEGNNYIKQYSEYKVDSIYLEHWKTSHDLIDNMGSLDFDATYPDEFPAYLLFPCHFIADKLGIERVTKSITL